MLPHLSIHAGGATPTGGRQGAVQRVQEVGAALVRGERDIRNSYAKFNEVIGTDESRPTALETA